MKRDEMLDLAKDYVMHDRANTHGKAEDTFSKIADLWSAYLDVAVTPSDVASMMVLLKIARISQNPEHMDSWVDIAGYAACGAEVSTPEAPKKPYTGTFTSTDTQIEMNLFPATYSWGYTKNEKRKKRIEEFLNKEGDDDD